MMSSRVDLSGSDHKILMAPPRINLRRAASYNAADRGPMSATSSRFNFNHLLFSPPPSPRLPALVPIPRKTRSQLIQSRPSRMLRYFIYFIGLCTLYLIASNLFWNRKVYIPSHWPYFSHYEFEMVGQDDLPDFPTPIVIADTSGTAKWTVSIPSDYAFPLSIKEYHDVSVQCREISARARDLDNEAPVTEKQILRYDAPDDSYVDVGEAENTGLLANSAKGQREQNAKGAGHFVGLSFQSMAGKPVCESSLTYVLESNDAGLGNAIMMMWTFYGLAKEQGRAFFIEDSRWAYGRYSNIFRPPPAPDCRPPPRHHMVPCPVQAKHLTVSAMTAPEVFPALMAKHHRISGSGNPTMDTFSLARVGYDDLFGLNLEDQAYVTQRVRELKNKAKSAVSESLDPPIIGFHVRHGDRHPLEYQYQSTYVPHQVYLDTSERLVKSYYDDRSSKMPRVSSLESVTIMASDDPNTYTAPEFSHALNAQNRIRLISKQEPDSDPSDPSVLHAFKDQSFGWEGGFFAPMFWNLGMKRKNNAGTGPTGGLLGDTGNAHRTPSSHTLNLRNMVGRAYLMDLTILAEASDRVVCTVSATGCRLLGVMMGWDKGVGGGGWVNVDGDYGWTGISW